MTSRPDRAAAPSPRLRGEGRGEGRRCAEACGRPHSGPLPMPERPGGHRSSAGLGHDHRHRWSGGLGQGHAGQAHRRALRARPSRHRPALPRRGPRRARRGALGDPGSRSPRRPRSGHARRSRLRGPGAGEAASIVARIPEVRAAILDYQRAFARRPAGAVLDGRDIGTVVCPDADVKIYVTATPRCAPSGAIWSCKAAASPPATRRCWPTSAAATSATRCARCRPCGRPPTPSCWIPAIWI